MAKRSKLQPAVKTMVFNLTNSGDNSYVHDTIDISQCASMCNRRFYRQGLEWAVAGFTILTTSSGNVTVSKIPDTWSASNAWTKAFHAWKNQQDEAVDDAGAESAVARYRDFKIFADQFHHAAGVAGNLLPIDITGAPFMAGEWEASEILIPDTGGALPGDPYFLLMTGDDIGGAGGAKALIKGYENSRAFPQSPDPVSPDLASLDNWYNLMHDTGSINVDLIDNATDRNDDLPYDQDNYPGGDTNAPYLQVVDEAYMTPTTVGGKTTMSGGVFPCGLIRIRNQSGDESGWASAPRVLVHLVPGRSRGYLTEGMA